MKLKNNKIKKKINRMKFDNSSEFIKNQTIT